VAEETVAGFVRRRLWTEFLEYAINPFVAGVYAGDPEVLSVKAAFTRLYELEQAHGSLIRGYLAGGAARKRNPEKSKHAAPMFAFRNGMQTLTDAIAGKLAHVELATAALKVVPGPDCHSVTVRSPHGLRDFRARAVVLATPAHAAAGLVGGFSPAAGVALTTIPYPPVAVAVCGYLRDAIGHPLDGFGVLVPQRERGQTLGTLFSSSLFEHRAPSGKVMLTTFVGGTRQPSLARLDEAEIAAIVQASHVATLSARNPPDFVRIKRWEQAIPQYTLGHHNRISAVDAAERAFPGVFFCANYRGGVAIGDCVKAAHGMAGKVENFLRGS
jgi:oxygen-dependent protoporphyrinogen oxidase